MYGNIYRSPSNNIYSNEVFINTLHNCLDIIGPNKKCFIVEDLNYNLANHDNSHVSNFTELMLEKSYFSVINLPSNTSDSNATVLDHTWTNLCSNQIKSEIILHSISDHLPTFACVNMNKSLPCPETKRLFTLQNIKKFNQSLNKIGITPILNEHNLDFFFFFSFRPFPLFRVGHSVSSFSTSFCLQCPSPSHQLPSYLLLPHLKIFSLVSLFSSFLVTPFPSSFFYILLVSPHDMSIPPQPALPHLHS